MSPLRNPMEAHEKLPCKRQCFSAPEDADAIVSELALPCEPAPDGLDAPIGLRTAASLQDRLQSSNSDEHSSFANGDGAQRARSQEAWVEKNYSIWFWKQLNVAASLLNAASAGQLKLIASIDKISRTAGKSRAAVFLLIVLGMLAYIAFNLVLVASPRKTLRITQEKMLYTSRELPLPAVAVTADTEVVLEIRHKTIQHGNTNSTVDTLVAAIACDTHSRGRLWKRTWCLPGGLGVEGSFGDPVYKFVQVDCYLLANSSSKEVYLELHLETKDNIHNAHDEAILHSSLVQWRTMVEVFFTKIIAIEEKHPWGFFGSRDEESLRRAGRVYLTYDREYLRTTSGWTTNGLKNVFTFYFRTSARQNKDFYTSYDFLDMLQALGGVWTAVLGAASICLFIFHGGGFFFWHTCWQNPTSEVTTVSSTSQCTDILCLES